MTTFKDRRVFDILSHETFARLSGDYNPIHMDPIAARRTNATAPIVHGIHSLIWILESFAQSDLYLSGVRHIKANFLQPIYVGEEVTLNFSRASPGVIRACITAGSVETVVAFLDVHNGKATRLSIPQACSSRINPPDFPAQPCLEEIQDFGGWLQYGSTSCQAGVMFPYATKAYGTQRIEALACASCVVGMVVPGLHSMLMGVDVSLCYDGITAENCLQFGVVSVSDRFRLVRIGIRAPGIEGYLETVSRPPPMKQPSTESLLSLVEGDEFRGSTALIIGGSRGLGELTAKLVAVGGGTVVITYRSGKKDADAVVNDMRAAGVSCSTIAYDVLRPASEQLSAISAIPTHIYYFATPPIFRRKSSLFDLGRLAEFNSFYINSFFDVVQTCLRMRPEGIKAFFPSSTAIDVRPPTMTEYTMSKASAEVLCADMSRFMSGVRVLTRRLPRLPTDQTNSFVQAESVNPTEILLQIVREMHGPEAKPCAL